MNGVTELNIDQLNFLQDEAYRRFTMHMKAANKELEAYLKIGEMIKEKKSLTKV